MSDMIRPGGQGQQQGQEMRQWAMDVGSVGAIPAHWDDQAVVC